MPRVRNTIIYSSTYVVGGYLWRVCVCGKGESNTQVEDILLFFLLVFSDAVHLLGAGSWAVESGKTRISFAAAVMSGDRIGRNK